MDQQEHLICLRPLEKNGVEISAGFSNLMDRILQRAHIKHSTVLPPFTGVSILQRRCMEPR
jgi:hypothetical protein